jgi:hypothetical protein
MKKTEAKNMGIADLDDVTLQRDGLHAFALYQELLEYGTNGKLVRHVRLLVCSNMVVTSERQAGRKSGRWAATPATDLDAAKKAAEAFLAKFGKGNRTVVPRGRPQLIELKGADTDAIAKGETPFAKYTGKFAVDHRFGKMAENDAEVADYDLTAAVKDLAKYVDLDVEACLASAGHSAPTPGTTATATTIAPF